MSMKTISIFLAVVSVILSQCTVSPQGFIDASSSTLLLIPDLDNVMQNLTLPDSSSNAKIDTKPRSSSGSVPDLDAAVRASMAPGIRQSMSASRNSMEAGNVGTENNRGLMGRGLRSGSPIGASMGPGFGSMSSDFMSMEGGLSRMIGGNLGLMGSPNVVSAETRTGIESAINTGMNRDYMMGANMGQGFGMGSNRAINGGVGNFGNDLIGSFSTGRIGNHGFSGSDVVGGSMRTSDGRNNDAKDSGMEMSVSSGNDNTGARTDRRELGSGMSGIRGLMDGMVPGSMVEMTPGSMHSGVTPGSVGVMMPGSMGGMVSDLMGRMTSGSMAGMTPGSLGGTMQESMNGMMPRTLGSLAAGAMGGMSGSMDGMMSASMGGIAPGSMGGLMSGSFTYPSVGGIGTDHRVSGRFDNSAVTGDAMSSDVFNLSRTFGSGFDGRIGSGQTGGMGGSMGAISGLSTLMIDPRFMSLMGSDMMTPDLLGLSRMVDSRLTGVSPFGLVSGMPGDFGSIGENVRGTFGPSISRFAGIGGTSGGISDFMYPFSMTSFPVTGTPLPFF